MILEINNKYCFLGKIENINKGDSWANITVILEDGNKQNIKMEPTIIDNYEMNLVYYFETICKEREGKPYLWLISSKTLYEYVISECSKHVSNVAQGVFGAHMDVSLINHGPFTILLDSDEICR